MIWAIVSSQSCFCWLYRASPSLAAKTIIDLISVLTIWWCPCIESSLFAGRTDAEAEAPVLWPSDGKSWLTGKDPDAGEDWRQEEKGMTKDEMVGWHYRLDGHEFEQAPEVGDGQGSLACCSPWGHRVRYDWETEPRLKSFRGKVERISYPFPHSHSPRNCSFNFFMMAVLRAARWSLLQLSYFLWYLGTWISISWT